METPKWKQPTEAQKKFFARNRLVLPPTAKIAGNIIAFIQEEEGAMYLQKIEVVRSLQKLIGMRLDNGEVIEYITTLPFARRYRHRQHHSPRTKRASPVLAGLRRPKGRIVQQGLEFCIKDGTPLLVNKAGDKVVDWERFCLFREDLLQDVKRRAVQFIADAPKWRFGMGLRNDFDFWITPGKSASGKDVPANGDEQLGMAHAFATDEELNQVGEMLGQIALPNGVKIIQVSNNGFARYRLSINPLLFEKKDE